MTRGHLLVVALAATWLACVDAYGTDRPDREVDADAGRVTGERGGACYPNATCNAPLTCIDSLCVLLEGEGGGRLRPNYDGYIETACAYFLECLPGAYTDIGSCVSAFRKSLEVGTPGLLDPTQSQLDACTAKFNALTTCDGSIDFVECSWRGTLQNGTPCQTRGQCSGGACNRTDAVNSCGLCASAVPKDGACDPTRDCDAGLACVGGICREPLARGLDCSANPFDCATGLACVAGKCATPLGVGADCPTRFECARPLECNYRTNKCVERKNKAIGEDCDVLAAEYCQSSRCDTANKCVAYLGLGAACTANYECEGALSCDANVCQVRAKAPTCP